jgi:hypothetical protein
MMFLLDLACYMKASVQKSEGKGVAFGSFPSFFFDDYLGKYGRYQFPLTSTRNYEVSSS